MTLESVNRQAALGCYALLAAFIFHNCQIQRHENRIEKLEQQQATPEPRVQLRPAFRIDGKGQQPALVEGLKIAAN